MCGGGEIRKMNLKKKPDSSAFSVTRGARNKVSSENIFFHDDLFWEQKGQRMKNIMEVKSSFRQRIIFNNVFFLLITKISSILYIWIKRPNNCFSPKTIFCRLFSTKVVAQSFLLLLKTIFICFNFAQKIILQCNALASHCLCTKDLH